MLSTAVIVFREVLEISLILGVVLVATRELVGRRRWTLAGLCAGIAGSALVALGAGRISDAVSGMGQELFDATVMLLAAVLIGWTVVWMKRHSTGLIRQLTAVGEAVAAGHRPLYVLAAVVALAVLREGSEIVLLTYGVIISGQTVFQTVAGGLIGLGVGTLVGLMIYSGLVRVPTRHLFSVTAVLLTFLAAAMVSQAVELLGAAGFITVLAAPLWDTSRFLSEHGLTGSILHALVGYSAQPSGIQFAAFLTTLATIALLMKSAGRSVAVATGAPALRTARRERAGSRGGSKAASLAVGMAAIGAMLSPADAHATKKVYSPIVEYRELEIEARGRYDLDGEPAKDGKQKQKYAVGYGVTQRWFTEVYGEIEKSPSGSFEFTALEFENRLQLFEPGERWLDMGLYFSYEVSLEAGKADKFEAKVLFQKQHGRLLHIANLMLEKEVGLNAVEATAAGLAWSTRYRLGRRFEPGVEVHSDFGELADVSPMRDQVHLAGPVIYGKLGHNVKYDIGYLFGVSNGASDGVLKWIIEYEFAF